MVGECVVGDEVSRREMRVFAVQRPGEGTSGVGSTDCAMHLLAMQKDSRNEVIMLKNGGSSMLHRDACIVGRLNERAPRKAPAC